MASSMRRFFSLRFFLRLPPEELLESAPGGVCGVVFVLDTCGASERAAGVLAILGAPARLAVS